MPYWACARLVPHQERLALFHLERIGFATYLPRLREWRRSHGRKIEVRPPLFPGYCFFVIEAQWHAARWTWQFRGCQMASRGLSVSLDRTMEARWPGRNAFARNGRREERMLRGIAA